MGRMGWRDVIGLLSLAALPVLIALDLARRPERLHSIVGVGLLIVAALAVVAVLVLLSERLERRRNRRLSAALGWRPPVGDETVGSARQDLPSLRVAAPLRVTELALVEDSGTRAWTADLEAVYSWAFERQPHPARFTAAALELPLAGIPSTLILGPAPFVEGDWAFDGPPDEVLEQVAFPPPFGARWRVWAREPEAARRLLGPQAQEWLLQAVDDGLAGCEFELGGAWLLGRVPTLPFAGRPALLEATRALGDRLGL